MSLQRWRACSGLSPGRPSPYSAETPICENRNHELLKLKFPLKLKKPSVTNRAQCSIFCGSGTNFEVFRRYGQTARLHHGHNHPHTDKLTPRVSRSFRL
jgi:hypothetical protein